ncbi:right-handed parallel beta-helix repeat-containing protein [Paenibacillus soyae]|uniref:Right-handed parallel beta-helix repeat-containing protein n=1 Tax=Paenibacillus soyae TaxID=2969249 RepID=A0A9X2S8W3_9BACL|nr:right-handed parallel beta-helix repeat-containing protein [Paenibacillus soyae]MCR2804844.1 right-handed parallel beta-helix repeat-containing protein [Paenibacillus soyae]
MIWCLLIGMQLSLAQLPLRAAADIGTSFQAKGSAMAENHAGSVQSESEKTDEGKLPTGADAERYQETPHVIDLKKWGISNEGKDSVKTTKGINAALKWAHKNGITAVTLPAGTYLIDKNSRINMVGNMLFELTNDVILQKEKNGKELYHLLYIGLGADNVTIRGGVYIGDRDAHDYSKKDHKYSSGTHEGGYGIAVEGADSVTIEGVKSTHFTGDGLILGGYGTMVLDLYENSFVSGEYNEKGKPAANKEKIRTVKPLRFDHAIFKTKRYFELSNPIKLPGVFDVFFFDKSGKLLKTMSGVKTRDQIAIPDGTDYAHLEFTKKDTKGAYIEFWNRVVSTNVVVRDSEFAYNRRQGITVGGADRVLIEDNVLHHMKGTMPQAGIDVEGGFHVNGYFNSNVTIQNNRFHDNASYDVVLFDGKDAVVRGNHLASKGAIGLAVSEPFTGAVVENNLFENSRIFAYHDVTLRDNKLVSSYTTLTGPRIKIEGMELINSTLGISASEPFGVEASDVTITSTDKKSEAGLSLWGKRIKLNNITISGESKLRTVTGGIEPGSIINGLKVTNFNSTYGLSLPPATYNDCEFAGAEGAYYGSIGVSAAGKYVFDGCTFKISRTAATGIAAENPKLELTVKNSSFEILGNASAISVQAAKDVLLENNTIVASQLTNEKTELIRLNDYWKRDEKNDIMKAVIRGNTITANLAAIGISTIHAGKGAPPYTVEDNTLVKAKLALKSNDAQKNNVLK